MTRAGTHNRHHEAQTARIDHAVDALLDQDFAIVLGAATVAEIASWRMKVCRILSGGLTGWCLDARMHRKCAGAGGHTQQYSL